MNKPPTKHRTRLSEEMEKKLEETSGRRKAFLAKQRRTRKLNKK